MIKFINFFKFFVLALFIFLLQNGLINSMPGILSRINLFPFLIIFLFIFYNFQASLYFSVFLGFLLDIFSFYPFGVYLVSFLVVLSLANFFWDKFFTNKSVYSFLALSSFLLFFYNIVLYSIIYYFDSFYLDFFYFGKIFWINLFWEFFWLNLGVLISFYLMQTNNKKFLS